MEIDPWLQGRGRKPSHDVGFENIDRIIEATQRQLQQEKDVESALILERTGETEMKFLKVPDSLLENKNELFQAASAISDSTDATAFCIISTGRVFRGPLDKGSEFDEVTQALKKMDKMSLALLKSKLDHTEAVVFQIGSKQADKQFSSFVGYMPFSREADGSVKDIQTVEWIPQTATEL